MFARAAVSRRSLVVNRPAAVLRVRRWSTFQPRLSTHPGLFSRHHRVAGRDPGDEWIIPGFTRAEFARRRRALMALLPRNSLVVLSGNSERTMSADIPYPFRQRSDVQYLTGFLEPDGAVLVRGGAVDVGPTTAYASHQQAMIREMMNGHYDAADAVGVDDDPAWSLFLRASDPERERWDGARLGVDGARAHFHDVAHVAPIEQLGAELAAAVSQCDHVFWLPMEPAGARGDRLLEAAFAELPVDLQSKRRGSALLELALQWTRVRKSEQETAAQLQAAEISGRAFTSAMRATRAAGASPSPLMESDVAAELEYRSVLGGAQRLSFPPVVAGGAAGLTLHYVSNAQPVQPGQLLLVDAGAELWGYTADITRVWPAGPQGFSPAQAAVYARVLDVNQRCVAACVEGASLLSVHQLAVQLLVDHLRHLGVRMEPSAYFDFFPHSIGHWLGHDLHDTPLVRGEAKLVPGHCLAIEPGLYLPVDDPRVPPELRGIAVRIEDNVVVQPDGRPPVNLSQCIPKEIDAIENVIMNQ